jgi:hypothetical protein
MVYPCPILVFSHLFKAALAEQEREFISLRTKQALAPMKGTGKLGGNRGNIDKANAAARALADTHAAKVIDVIRPMKEAGQTLQQIADALNKLGLPTVVGGIQLRLRTFWRGCWDDKGCAVMYYRNEKGGYFSRSQLFSTSASIDKYRILPEINLRSVFCS